MPERAEVEIMLIIKIYLRDTKRGQKTCEYLMFMALVERAKHNSPVGPFNEKNPPFTNFRHYEFF